MATLHVGAAALITMVTLVTGMTTDAWQSHNLSSAPSDFPTDASPESSEAALTTDESRSAGLDDPPVGHTESVVYFELLAAGGIDRYGGGLTLVLGTVGNALAIAVLRQKRMRRSATSLYFVALAASDFVMCLVGQGARHFVRTVSGLDPPILHTWYCKVWFLIINYSSGWSNWVLAGVSIERCVAVISPLQVRVWMTRRTAKLYLLGSLLAVLAYYSHSVFSYHTITTFSPDGRSHSACVADVSNYFVVKVRPWSDLVFKGVIPGVTIILCNVIIIKELTAAALRRKRDLTQENTKNTTTGSLVRMLIMISVAYVIFTLPYHVSYILTNSYTAGYSTGSHAEAVSRLVWAVNIFLLYCNHSFNFVIYLVSGGEFRAELWRLMRRCCCCRNAAGDGRMYVSDSTGSRRNQESNREGSSNAAGSRRNQDNSREGSSNVAGSGRNQDNSREGSSTATPQEKF